MVCGAGGGAPLATWLLGHLAHWLIGSLATWPRLTAADDVLLCRGLVVQGRGSRAWSATQTELADQRPVAPDVDVREVLEQAATPADQQQEAPAAVVVVLVVFEMLGEVVDALGHQRDLHLRRAGVTLRAGMLGDDPLLRGGLGRHVYPSVVVARRARAGPPRLSSVRGRSDGTVSLPARPRAGPTDLSRSAQQDPSGIDVGVHLCDERLHRVEPHGWPQPADKLEHDDVAVEVEVAAVEYVGLDRAPVTLEGRVGAHRDGSREPFPCVPPCVRTLVLCVRRAIGADPAQPAGVDTVGGNHPLAVLGQVGRREPEVCSSRLATHHRTTQPVAAAQDLLGTVDFAARQQLAYPGRRPASLHGTRLTGSRLVDDVDLEPVFPAQLHHRGQVAGVAPPEAHVVPDDHAG